MLLHRLFVRLSAHGCMWTPSYRGPAPATLGFKPVTITVAVTGSGKRRCLTPSVIPAWAVRPLVGDALTFYASTLAVRRRGIFLIASALHHLLASQNDVVVLLAAAAGVTDSRRVAYRRYLDATEELRWPVCTLSP